MASLDLNKERSFYHEHLITSIAPFWVKHARDEECGGYYTCLRRDGTVFDTAKVSTWSLGRIAWSYAYLFNDFEPRQDWLKLTTHGIDFMLRTGFDEDGRVYGALTRKGKPLAKAFDIYHDLFWAQAFAECAKALGEKSLLRQAKRLTFLIDQVVRNPQKNPHHKNFILTGQVVSNHPEYIILLENVQILRKYDDDPRYDEIASYCANQILSLHYSEQKRAVFELVTLDGTELPTWISQWVCPGHMYESGWMLIKEGEHRNDQGLVQHGLKIIDWATEIGWDQEFGGIPNDINIAGEFLYGTQFYLAPMKLWWQALEAIYANLLAYKMTGENKFLERYLKVRDWSFEHFVDHQHGEWFGTLSPEGKILDAGAKAYAIKSCQHTVRTIYNCYKLLDEQVARKAGRGGDSSGVRS